MNCRYRSRNKGLYVANDLAPNGGGGAHQTRQNAAGTRFGTECAEERDYYPYWHPSMWRDVAVLTNEPQRCQAYQDESENIKGRWYCEIPERVFRTYQLAGTTGWLPIQKASCEAFQKFQNGTNSGSFGVWKQAPAHGIPAPVCRQNIYTRDNHLGNTLGGYPVNFNWTVPEHAIAERCVLRIRYNMTSNDFEGFESVSSVRGHPLINASASAPVVNGVTNVDVYTKYGMTVTENGVTNNADAANSRGYRHDDNPRVDIFGSLLGYDGATTNRIKFQLAQATEQFSRTFEDRSHRFAVRPSAGIVPNGAVIHNIGVRGKRGNIVQVFPAVEYDFVPNRLSATVGDFVHFQWTGSNTNNRNNDGAGLAGTDRSNVVGLRDKTFVESDYVVETTTFGGLGNNYPKRLNEQTNFLGWDNTTLIKMAILQQANGQFGGDMHLLNDAGTYFDAGPKRVTKVGIFNYMCTRNNDFSNRSQKGVIAVLNSRSTAELIGWGGGSIAPSSSANVWVPEGTFSTPQQVSMTVTPAASAPVRVPDMASDVVNLAVAVTGTTAATLGGPVKLTIAHSASPLGNTRIMYSDSLNGPWTEVSTTVGATSASTMTSQTGYYVVSSPLDAGTIAGLAIGGAAILALAAFLIIYCRKKAVRAAYEAMPSAEAPALNA